MILKQLPQIIGELNTLGIALKSLDAMNFGAVGVNLANVEAYRTALKGLSVEQSVFALASKGATEEQIRQILVTNQSMSADVEAALAKAGLTTATQALNAEEMIALATKRGIATERAEEIASALGLIATEKGQIISKKQLTVATLQQAGATDTEIAAMLGLNAVETTNIGITNVLTASFTKLWAVITAHPIGAILTAIGVVAVSAVAAYNKWGDTLENTKEKLSDLKSECQKIVSDLQAVNSELETTQQRLEELEKKDTLTFTEKEEYDNLVKINNELQRKIDLLELEEKNKRKEQNKTFVSAMKKDTEDPFEHEVNPDGKKPAGQYSISDEYLTSEIGYINAQFEIREQLLDDLANAETEKEKERIQKRIDEINSYLEDKNTEWKTVSDGIDYIENPTTEDDKAVNEWLDYIADFQDRMAIAMGGDNAKTNTFNRLVDNWKFDDTVQGLQDLGAQGKVTAEMLNDPKYDEFINKLVELGVIDSADNLNDIAKAFNGLYSDSYQNLIDLFGQDAVDKLTPEDLEIAYTISSEEADKALEQEKKKIKSELESLSKEGNVDLTIRPVIDSSAMQAAGWDVEDGSIATTFTQGEFVWQGDEENGQYVYIHYTPILPDGTVLTPDELTDYLYGTLEGSQSVLDADNKGIVLKVDTDLNIPEGDIKKFTNGEGSTDAIDGLIQKTGEWDDKVHGVQEQYYDTGEGIGYASNALDGLIEKHKQLENSDKITDSFASIFNSSDFSEQKQSLIDLAKAGELTNKALSSDDYSDFIDKLEEIGISAEEAKTEILSLLDATEKLSGASKSISGLENAYNEFQEKGYVLAETIESIPDVFRELETYDFDVFENIIGNPKNIEEMQGAFNDLVTAYISEMAVLSDVSEAEAQRFIANLREIGVTNAEEVVNSVLALNDSMKATAKEAESTAQEINDFLVNVKGKAASATNDLINCTWSEINALIEEGNKFGYTTSKIEEFALQKLYANRCNLDVNDDITGLVMLAETLGICSEAVASYKQIVELAKQGYGGGYGQAEAEAKRLTEKIRKEIEALYTPKYTPTVSYKAPTSSSSSSTSSSKETEKTAETFDWIEKLLERIQSRIDSLDKTASSTYKSWAKRNKALLKQLSEVNTEINAQQKAYDTYMAKANSVGLSEHYKQLVQNGGYSIEDITDDTLKNKISEYEEWYNKAMDCSDAIDDLKNNILELTTTQFENVFNEYEDSLSGYRHQIEMLQTYIDQTEAKGYVVSGNYYKQLIETEKLNIKMLQDEYAKLKDSLQLSVDTGKIVAYSDAWYDMVDNIRNVQKSIEDANTSLIDYQTTLRELEWESFDRFMDKISKIKDESDFLIELMSDKDMFNEDGITDEGQATLGLHAINYNVYLSQAEEYAKELKDINEEIANDPNNQTLLERRQELLELQQEAILAAKSEKDAMLELKKEGFDIFLESLQEIIDKQKELLNSQKD